jgi:hypothetical protein
MISNRGGGGATDNRCSCPERDQLAWEQNYKKKYTYLFKIVHLDFVGSIHHRCETSLKDRLDKVNNCTTRVGGQPVDHKEVDNIHFDNLYTSIKCKAHTVSIDRNCHHHKGDNTWRWGRKKRGNIPMLEGRVRRPASRRESCPTEGDSC